MFPTLVEVPPEGDEWIHEVKYDGFRTQLIVRNGSCQAFTRTGKDWSNAYPRVIEAGLALPCKAAIIDGEAIITDEHNKPQFYGLLRAIRRQPDRVVLVAFDLLHLDGEDLRRRPLIERREMLWKLIAPAEGAIQYSQHMQTSGADFYRAVDRMGLEGMVSKRANSTYRSGKAASWLKIKCYEEKVLDIIGVQRERGKPAMVLMAENGQYKGGAFVTFPPRIREQLWARVQGKVGAPAPKGLAKEKAEWVKPGLIGRVRTLRGEEKLRHAKLMDWGGE